MEFIKLFNENQPKFETTLPFSKENILFNSFKVKDSKKLTIVLQEQNKKLALVALYECISSNSDNKNISNMCLADCEYLFLKIRSKSVDEFINVTANGIKTQINIDEIKFKNSLQKKTISIGNNVSITLTTPTIKKLISLSSFDDESYAKACIESIIINGQVYHTDKFVPKEFMEMVENLPLSASKQINEFVLNEPKLYFTINTDKEESEVSGLLSFFI